MVYLCLIKKDEFFKTTVFAFIDSSGCFCKVCSLVLKRQQLIKYDLFLAALLFLFLGNLNKIHNKICEKKYQFKISFCTKCMQGIHMSCLSK